MITHGKACTGGGAGAAASCDATRRQTVFFCDADYDAHRALVAEHCGAAGVAVWAYCLMPDHVHLILVPPVETALHRALGEASGITVTVTELNRFRGWLPWLHQVGLPAGTFPTH